MNKLIKPSLFTIILIISSIITNSCERDGTVSCFPNEIIDAQIILNGYTNLSTEGWEYSKGEIGTGTRGLIIYQKSAGEFIIYNRNAPHLCPDNDTTLTVITDSDGFLKIYCPKDGAKWVLINGQPNNSQATGIPWTYPHNYNAATNTLTIYN